MNTKLLMISSSILMGITGILLSFAPIEILNTFNEPATVLNSLVLQLSGALYFSFAMVNWTAKANLIGGIYGRPIAIGNLAHFMIGALALINAYSSGSDMAILPVIGIYSLFAFLFGVVFFTHPVKADNK